MCVSVGSCGQVEPNAKSRKGKMDCITHRAGIEVIVHFIF